MARITSLLPISPYGIYTTLIEKYFSQLKGFLLGSGNNFLLVVLVQVNEIITVTGYPNQQVFVIPRRRLGPAQGLGIDDIELDMMPIEFKIGPDEMG